MTTTYRPYSLVYDAETTRPGEQVHAEPDPLSEDRARRLRDIERAGGLRNRVYSAGFGAAECAHFCRFTLRDERRLALFEAQARFYGQLYEKTCRLQARVRGEA